MTRISAEWLHDPASQAVCRVLSDAGFQALFVGGCVRNALIGAPVRDLDISTDARPETVMDLARRAGIKAVPTGIDHGTVTLVENGIPFEITTFRKDVETDGRRAVIAFADDVRDDAMRRDFTMNALYVGPDGAVLDPLGGLPDLQARRVRFIGHAQDRIREDYLRSLRYFRFHAWYGDAQAGIDADALSAIAGNLDGLSRLSHERIGAEMLRLLAASDPAPSVAAMAACGALAQLLPGASDRALPILVHLETQVEADPDPLRRLAALGGQDIARHLRLSRADAARLDRLTQAASDTQGPAELGYRLKQPDARDALLLRCALLEQPWPPRATEQIDQGAHAQFPVTARDLMPAYRHAALGARLKLLERAWIASGFALDKAALLALPDRPIYPD